MLWLIPTALILFIIAYYLGYYSRNIEKHIEYLEEVVKSKIDKEPVIEEPKSEIIDPDDPIQTAIYERDKIMKKLNP